MQNTQELIQQIKQKITQFEMINAEKQADLANELHQKIQQSQQLQTHLIDGEQQLAAQLEYSSTILLDLEQGATWDFAQELEELEQAFQQENANADKLNAQFEQQAQEKITFHFNELKAKTMIALQELNAVNAQIRQYFAGEENVKRNKWASTMRVANRKLGRLLNASRHLLANQLERSASCLRP